MSPTIAALLGVRLIGLVLCLIGLHQGIANLVDGWRGFNPAHAGHFFRQLMLRPALWLVLGLMLMLAAPLFGPLLV